MMIKYYFFITFALILLTACSGGTLNTISPHFRFAIIGNTYPDSPFSGDPEFLSDIIHDIKKRNPLFIMHLGNIFHGGHSWMGLKESDINRQLDFLTKHFSSTGSALYTVIGEKDLYNGNYKDYTRAFNRPSSYSFNCAGAKFIIFNTIAILDKNLSSMKWLENELENSRNYNRIYIFTYNSIYISATKPGLYQDHEKFHNLIKKFKVKSVFSSNPPDNISFEKDHILYNITGCGGYSKNNTNWKTINYYMVEVYNDSVNILTVKVK